MKLSIRENMVPGKSLLEKCERLADLGFQGIEIVDSSRPECVEEIKKARDATGIQPTITSARDGALLDARKSERDTAVACHKLALQIAGEIGAKGILGQAHFDLGRLHKAKKRKNKARAYLTKAIEHFKLCEAETFLKQANEALESM